MATRLAHETAEEAPGWAPEAEDGAEGQGAGRAEVEDPANPRTRSCALDADDDARVALPDQEIEAQAQLHAPFASPPPSPQSPLPPRAGWSNQTASLDDDAPSGPLAHTRAALWDTLSALEAETADAWIRLGDDLFGIPAARLAPASPPQSEDEGETSGGGGVAIELGGIPGEQAAPPPAPERAARSATSAPLAPRRGAR